MLPTSLPVDESHQLSPVDINGVHRLASEQYHRLYDRVYGLNSVILRLTNTVGPRMRVRDARQTFAGLWVRNALEGKPLEVWGGQQIRDFNFVDDVVDALLLAASSTLQGGCVYNLGSNEPLTLEELAEIFRELTGCSISVRPFPQERLGIDIGNYYANYSRATRDLGWAPRTGVREAIRLTLSYYEENLREYV